MKERLYGILSVENSEQTISKLYNLVNILLTFVSLVPLMFQEQTDFLINIEAVAVVFFVLDYFLRWYTADIKFPNRSKRQAYLVYPFTLFAIVDLLAILPFVTFLNQSLRLFRLFRLTRSLRVFRSFRLFRYSKSLGILIETIKKQRNSLTIVGVLVASYIFIAALLVFNVEPETFPSFLEALLWATSSLTTATYGEIYPTSSIGQILSIISYLVGVGIIALPSSVLTAGYIQELENQEDLTVEGEDEEDGDEEVKEVEAGD